MKGSPAVAESSATEEEHSERKHEEARGRALALGGPRDLVLLGGPRRA